MGCVLEVDVDGEGVFFVDKDVLAPFSGKIKNLFDERPVGRGARRPPRVVLHGFPGGAETFELVARFCYTGGGLAVVTAANACALRCAAEFMNMAPSLAKLAEKALDEMPHWLWQSVVDAVRQCERLLPLAESTGVLGRVAGALLSHMAVVGDATPTSSSPESSAFRFSCDTKSSASLFSSTARCNGSSRTWWFEDLVVVLSPGMLERLARALLARGADHGVVARFLFYYLKCRLAGAANAEDKAAMLEAVIIVIADDLDRSSVSCKGLFGILRVASPLRLAGACQDRLVAMIGRKLDHATLDNLLVQAPCSGKKTRGGGGSLYDVGLVLRFLEAFLREEPEPARLKKVGALVDLYLAEVAPDPSLRPARFVELATALPPAARDCHDALYRAIDVYFQVHGRLTDEEKMKICKGINYERLSPDCCKHLARNAGFPTRAAVQALASQHAVLKGIIRHSGPMKPPPPSAPPATGKHQRDGHDDGGDQQQVVLYASRLELSLENQSLKSLLDGMNWRMMELEKVCSRMKTQMNKMKASRRGGVAAGCTARSLPRMCS